MSLERIKTAAWYVVNKFISERRGWKTARRIVVFESDDWGSIRMPDSATFQKLLHSGLRVDKCHYCSNDTLADTKDFSMLFDVLTQHKDYKGNHPVITANTVVANPDFDRIKDSDFNEYFYEPFTKTLNRYPNRDFESWKWGVENKLFFPQFHGREHLNVSRWMQLLKNGSKEVHLAFENNLFGISSTISNERNPSFMAALHADNAADLLKHESILKEGVELFQEIFNFKPHSFIAPNYIWHERDEKMLSELGIKYLQGNFTQLEPTLDTKLKWKLHYCGQSNQFGQTYLIRNCIFEPSALKHKEWADSCMKDISSAFLLNRPAIVTTHRVNFIGSINPSNRDNNLKQFDKLLNQIIKKWDNVEFMNSAQLGDLISSFNAE